MAVVINDDGRPVAYGSERLENGIHIPDPPEQHPAREYRWTDNEWIHDPQSEGPKPADMTQEEIASAVESGKISAQDALMAVLRQNDTKGKP